MTSKPTILFIHGSWHSPAHFRPVRDLFEAEGYPTECPRLPTFNSKPAPPVVSLIDDVQVVQNLLKKLVEEQEKEVLVVVHSYGGIVGSEAVLASFGRESRAKEGTGKKGGVLHLLYMCAFVVPVGASLSSALGGGLSPFVKVEENGLSTINSPDQICYNDLTLEQQKHWVEELGTAPTIVHMTSVTHAAHLHYPVTYLYCEEDQAMPLEIQERMVKEVGVEFQIKRCSAGHSPYLSQPETVLRVVEEIVEVI
ncbi:hypothetical protein SBOR_1222 [Sclerotinia borealis F-4128]|uniref:AB hydrolase-1 domain-containing protein n=1 Tax=Sclerotinia borealis (strain F-4128) TaxID=1432307 RepID=W9CUU1_SCLBF|nr:hypothetical protein SBOR_1222 [Sclerotinia borealis F-4128]